MKKGEGGRREEGERDEGKKGEREEGREGGREGGGRREEGGGGGRAGRREEGREGRRERGRKGGRREEGKSIRRNSFNVTPSHTWQHVIALHLSGNVKCKGIGSIGLLQQGLEQCWNLLPHLPSPTAPTHPFSTGNVLGIHWRITVCACMRACACVHACVHVYVCVETKHATAVLWYGCLTQPSFFSLC